MSYFNKTVASKDMSGYYLLLNGEYAYNKSYSVGYDFGSIKRLDRYPMGALSTLYICFALKKHDSDFIKAYFDSLKWYREIYMISAEGARNHGLLNIPTDEFFETKHYLPQNLNEQRKIADFIIALERRIDAQQSLVDNLKKYKRGLQNRFFFKRSHLSRTISGISSHEVKPLGSKVQINPKTESLPEAFIYIDLECVEAGVLHSKKLISRNSAPSRAQRLLKEGDLIYQMVRPYQKNNYYFQKAFEYPTVASTGYAQIRCSEVDTQFIYEQLSSDYFAREAMLRSTGTGYPAINADDLAEIPIWIPPLDQQEKVGATLSFIGAKIEVHQKMLYALCRVKSSLLQQLFI
ncbi:restriction endonuclease subunit S [Acidaminococcus sp. NSJ-142]|uniref:restriction endonuclease subunit S n=1 Tax=Acidaminococcus hominis TaxID=2897706 RepID=UPI001E4C6197|nr:restriction endonuclease subunit S [Acidaminococcus hominis]